MLIPVLVEPAFQRSFWCRQTINGLFAETKQKKYELTFLNGSAYESLDYDQLFSKNPRMIVVVGTSPSWMKQVLATLESHCIHSVLVNYDPSTPSAWQSVVRMDYVKAMQRLLSYFHSHGRRRIALLGVNPDSSADRIKAQYFSSVLLSQGEEKPHRHIFENPQNINVAIRRFLLHAADYDSVICANDLVAVSLLKGLKQTGLHVPEDLFVVGFGESILAQRCTPSLTTATLDHEALGRQAVRLFAYLQRQEIPLSASIRVESRLIIRQSTQNLPEDVLHQPLAATEDAPKVDFYNDEEIERLLVMERFHAGLDETDQRILTMIAEGHSQEAIAEICQISPSTVGYRIRSMQAEAGAASRQELIDLMIHSLHFQ